MLPLIAIRRDPLSKADHVDSLFRRTFLLEWKVGQVVEGSLEQHLVKNRQMKYCTQVEIEWTRWWKWSSDSGLLLLVRAACCAMPSCFARPGVGSSFCLASCSKRFHADVSWCFKSSSTTRYFQNVSSKVLVLRCTMLECAVGHFKDPKALFHRHYLLFRPRWLVCLLILLSNYQRLTHSLSHLLNNQSMNHSTVNNQKFHPAFHDSQWASIVLQVFYALKFQPITCPRLASFFSVKLMHIQYHPIVQEIVLSFVPVLGLRDELGRSVNLDPLMPLLMPSLGQQSNVVIPCPQVAKVLRPKSWCYVWTLQWKW